MYDSIQKLNMKLLDIDISKQKANALLNDILSTQKKSYINNINKQFKGKWKREDGVLIEFIGHPTNKFQIMNTIYDGKNIKFSIGNYKLIDISCIDSVNKVFTAKNLTVDYIYDNCGIRIIDNNSFLVFYNDGSKGNVYKKVE
jgi:hypothetical protein